MALNISTLKTRSLTAAVFVVVMMLGLCVNHWTFFLLFSIIHFGAWSEYQKLFAKIDPAYADITPFHKYGVRLAGWSLMLFFTGSMFSIGSLNLHSLGLWMGISFLFVLPIVELLFARTIQLQNIRISSLGLLYISLSWALMMDTWTLSSQLFSSYSGWLPKGVIIPMGVIFSIWINDTMAYIVGSLIGKTPLSKISPKKTWEGTIGGVLLAVALISWLGASVAPFNIMKWQHWTVIASMGAIIGTLGDLLESKIKRMADVKDSGSFMPGHGGFLDRFDSLILTVPFVWLYLVLVVYNA
ncbi:MAG: phosphatidate cytidylyltransferase [Chitinophagaceae bacterium]|jgi:phosphatidate cytidylyltransferase|uniref:phosphatidate cytidylyltransferase n=1 Tax=unclassified Paraflavitalea TaxID=2798305 RepID=UPI003D350FE1|nr:phosphatidate cytidylyltransferase [Chitinophagaceae bacterium]